MLESIPFNPKEHSFADTPVPRQVPLHNLALLIAYFVVVTGFALELDMLIFSVNILPDIIPDMERHMWIRHAYVPLIFLAAKYYRYYGLGISLFLTLGILIPHSLYLCNNVWHALGSMTVVLGLGTVSGLYRIQSEDCEAGRKFISEWYEKVQRRLHERARNGAERDKQFSTLSTFSQRVALCVEINDVINIGLDIAKETMKVDAVVIYSLKEETQELCLLASKGLAFEDDMKHQSIKLGEGLNGIVAQTGNPIISYDTCHANPLTEVLKKESFKAVGVTPLISRSKIVGTLTVATRKHHVFSMQEINVLETLGNQLGLAMENAILSDEQKIMQGQLRKSEKQYREIFEKTNDIIWLENLDGEITSANRSCAHIIGFELAQLINKNFFDFIPGDSISKATAVRQQLLNGEVVERSYDQTIINNRGAKIILKVTTNVMDFGKVKGFQHIAKDITEERKMHENLQFYIQQITRAQEEERLRISRELHDSTAQSLIAVLHQLEKYLLGSKHLLLSDSRFLCVIVEQVKGILQEVRHFSRDLRPSILDDLGLIPSLEWYLEELNRIHGLNIDFLVRGHKFRLLPEVEVTLFRLVQEALRNVIRHATATSASVFIQFTGQEITITVQDNGRGFVCEPIGDLLRHGKLGLAGMHERAKLLGGSIEIDSAKGKGTTLFITIPTTNVIQKQELN